MDKKTSTLGKTMTSRSVALKILHDALAQVDLATVLKQRLRCTADVFAIDDLTYPLDSIRRIVVVAIGKAAVPMCEVLLQVMAAALSPRRTLEGIVVGATAAVHPDSRLQYLVGNHPIPQEESSLAGDAVLDLLTRCDASCLVVVLLSGGASSMVEKPLDGRMTFDDVAGFHQALVLSGLAITPMNILRKHFSQVKGGRLALAAADSVFCTLVVSDVPAEAIHVVGSGPSLPDPSTTQDCRDILHWHRIALGLSDKVSAYFTDPMLQETPKAGHPAFRNGSWVTLLSSRDLAEAAYTSATATGFHAEIDNHCDEWAFDQAAKYLLDKVTSLHRKNDAVCLITVGELSVKVGGAHGTGGRNQHFVLECARLIAAENLPVTVLSIGSDGVDGNSPAAGAIADPSTFKRAKACGLSADQSLADCDSFRLFSALNDAIILGPTGNNLRDLRLLFIGNPAERIPS